MIFGRGLNQAHASVLGDNNVMNNPQAEKKAIRIQAIAARDAMPLDQRAAGASRVCEAIIASAPYKKSSTVLAYASFGSEIKGNFKMGYYLPMSLRLGLYHGIGGPGGARPRGEPLYFVAAVEGSFL